MTRLITSALVTMALAALALSRPAAAETIAFNVELSGANQVPPILTPGTGTLEATFDTESRVLTWVIVYSGMTDSPTAMHFHGPAIIGDNGPVAVPIEGDLSSPIEGEAVLSETQAAELLDGLWYLNIHTLANPSGELRGQLLPP